MKLFLFFFSLILMSPKVFAQQWYKMRPFATECKQFIIEYRKESNGLYKTRYKKTPSARNYTYPPHALNNINNLSLLTDTVVHAAENYCPGNFLDINDHDGSCSISYPEFSSNYEQLIKHISSVINISKNNCDDIIPFVKLQSQISGLDDSIIKSDKHFNILKPFVGLVGDGAELRSMIDMFEECGGKRGSDKFVANLILLMSKDACLFPQPPGMMSFEDAREISQEVAKNYKDHGIMSLNKVQKDIEKAVSIKATKKVIENSTKGLFGKNFDTDQFINSLPSIKNLHNVPPEMAIEFASYAATPRLPLEVIHYGLESMIEANFGDMLSDMSASKRKSILKNKLNPKIRSLYNKCISHATKTIKFYEKMDYQEQISHGKNLLRSYCRKYKLDPKQCVPEDYKAKDVPKLSCHHPEKKKIKNFYVHVRNDIADMDLVQACVLKSMTNGADILLEELIKGQKDAFKEYFDLDDKMAKDISKEANDKLIACTDKKVKAITKGRTKNNHSSSPFTRHIEPLYKIESDEFKKHYQNVLFKLKKE